MFEKRKTKKLDLAIEELEKQAKILNNEFVGINNWIENNIDTDPNLYQMIECAYNFGKLSSTYNYYYDKYKVRVPKDNENIMEDIVVGPAIKQDFLYYSPKNAYLGIAKKSLDRMKELRYSHDLFTNETAKKLYDTVYESAINGDFDIESEKANELKKEVLCKIGGVVNYIHQVQTKENPKYLYDNTEEFETLQKNFKDYLSISKNRQFESTMALGIVAINNNYLFNTEIDLGNQNKKKDKKIVYHAKKTFK